MDYALGINVYVKDLEDFFSRRLYSAIQKKKIKTEEIFFCQIYTAKLLQQTASRIPESWFAVDYLANCLRTGSAEELKKGGDVCFLICSIFIERGYYKLMKPEYYHEMGPAFYSSYYQNSNNLFCLHMGQQFEKIVQVTKESIQDLNVYRKIQ